MQCSTTTVDGGPGTVSVKVMTELVCGFFVPRADGDNEVRAVFKEFTFGDNVVIENETRRIEKTDLSYEPSEYRRLILKRNLVWWSLPVPIERNGDWMTPGSYARVGMVGAPLVDALLEEFMKTLSLAEEEEEQMKRQCAILFSDNSHGVANACDAVQKFCTYSSFWDKFGIGTGIPIDDMPFREYLMLKLMVRKEGESLRTRNRPKPTGGTKIAGPGGMVRPSQAKRIPL